MDKKKNISLNNVIVSGILSYIAAICSLPSTGIISTFPVAAICAIASSFICSSHILIYILFGLMPLLLNCLYGFELSRAILFTVIGIITVFFAILFKRAVVTVNYSKKNKNAQIRFKSTVVAVVCIIAEVIIWLFSAGNPVSALLASSRNKNYIEESYGDRVNTGYTYYDALKKGYFTEIEFEGMETGEAYYVCIPEYDGYKEYCKELISINARDYFEGRTTLDADSVLCYTDISDITVTPSDDFSKYFDRCEYLYKITSEIPGITGFKGIYENISHYLALSDTFVYKSITVSGTDVDGNAYFAYLPYGGEVEYYYNDAEFEKSITEKFYR